MQEPVDANRPQERSAEVLANRLELSGGGAEIGRQLNALDGNIANMLGRIFRGPQLDLGMKNKAASMLAGLNALLADPYGDGHTGREVPNQEAAEKVAFFVQQVARLGKVNADGSVTLNLSLEHSDPGALWTIIPADRIRGF